MPSIGSLMPPKIVPSRVQETDYSQFTVEQIKKQLADRGLETTGKKKTLVKRLKAEVQRAWSQYYDSQGKSKKKKAPKKKMTLEEITAQNKENAAKRKAKLKRKAENIAKMEEAKRAKRQKKEASAKIQAKRMAEQKEEKEKRQLLEVFVKLDIKDYQTQLQKKLDPKGTRIDTMSYNAVHKRFNIRFKNAAHQQAITKNATITKAKSYTLKMSASTLPAPVESRCVMFLYPAALNHPNKDAAQEWLEGQTGEGAQDLAALNLWKKSALSKFARYGKIVNVYRERSFLVVYFSTASEAQKMMKGAADSEFNGVPMLCMKVGTPTKQDKNELNKQYPIPKVPSKKKKKST